VNMVSPDNSSTGTRGKLQTRGEVAPSDDYRRLGHLICRLALEVPVKKFSVADLLRLKAGSILETAYHQSSDLPLYVNGQLVGWTEFEVVGDQLAVRLTDLS
jgi:flagellar motor switch/type III secretory pathway protein FliN